MVESVGMGLFEIERCLNFIIKFSEILEKFFLSE